MYLDEMLAAQKRGEARGIPSICSAHPLVLRQALRSLEHPLIEATCNQVNQFGGYTGMRPQDFVAFVHGIADDSGVAFENVLLGGDHLGPHVWQAEPGAAAMAKAEEMIAEYARAGFTKLHLDCSMRLADDPPGALEPELAARRAAQMAKIAEQTSNTPPRYVVGTEVPRPGGALAGEEGMRVTAVQDVRETIDIHRKAFREAGLEGAWERVTAVVVQPGVEFGDDFVTRYVPEAARELSRFIEGEALVYEAHSTDYQSLDALRDMVRGHFAILKVGPGLTFAYREAVFALALIEKEWLPEGARSKVIEVLERCMLEQPAYWRPYYHGSEQEQAFKRKYSLSDRVRYYWAQPQVQAAVEVLMNNLAQRRLPYSLASQFLGETGLTGEQAIERKIQKVLDDYVAACNDGQESRATLS